MSLGVLEEHEDLARTLRRWLEAHCPREVPRATLPLFDENATDNPPEPAPELPSIWKEFADQGWLGLHVDEEFGGEGFGVVELAVVLSELAYASAPGPVLPTVLTASALTSAGSPEQCHKFLPGLVDGSTPSAVFLGSGELHIDSKLDDGSLVVSGTLSPVLGAPVAKVLLVPVSGGGWCLLECGDGGEMGGESSAGEVRVEALTPLDSTRPVGEIHADRVSVPPMRQFENLDTRTLLDLALTMAAAECAGGSRWCLDTASQYAKERIQFGRPIGQFQAIKHKLADMLVMVEQAEAVAWDAAQALRDGGAPDGAGLEGDGSERSFAAAIAGSIALDTFVHCAKQCVQILGGIGFTWEHDAHIYLKRALSTRQLLGGIGELESSIAQMALSGVRRQIAADLPDEAEQIRAEIAPIVAKAAPLDIWTEQRRYLAENGLIAPNWPKPWGRDSGPLEQLVIDEEMARVGVNRPNLAVGAWALPTLISHGTPEQQERWVRPTLLGEISWCQLFSEPGAGSDLASLSTRAEKVDRGWRLNGQKVWTSLAHIADWGICLARTDPSAPKHDGISYFIVDMHSKGLEVRPLRELTGAALFNEVFFDSVFVPDDCLVGEPGEGWKIGRTTLSNERVSLSSGATFGAGAESVLKRVKSLGEDAPTGTLIRLGELLAEAHSLRLMGQRATLRALSGVDVGAVASVRKLLGAEHEQRIQETGLMLEGGCGAVAAGSAQRWSQGFLATRCLTIAGGTSEVQRNVIAERLLGQPRDPEPGS